MTYIPGTQFSDYLEGTEEDDTIIGWDPYHEEPNLNDRDWLEGLAGDDDLSGGYGADNLYGGEGDDYLSGGSESDYLYGDAGNDNLNGDTGNDNLSGGDGMDGLSGGEDDDYLSGGSESDYLYGGDGDDLLDGGDGDDLLDPGGGYNQLYGGSGVDTVDYRYYDDALEVDLNSGEVRFPGYSGPYGVDTLSGIENVIGGNNNDIFIDAAGGDNVFDGGSGVDTVDYGSSNHALVANLETGVVSHYTGVDNLSGIENVTGGNNNDILIDNWGDNTLRGDDGDDLIDAAGGYNFFDGGSGVDTVDYGSYDDALVANLNTGEVSFPYYSGPYGYGLDTLSGIENVTGGNNNDTLIDTLGSNTLSGGDGDDRINAADGYNFFDGGSGVDTVDYGSYYDALEVDLENGEVRFPGYTGPPGVDTLSGIENVIGGNNNDTLIDNLENNTLSGGDGDDRIDAAGGYNVFDGGSGVDTVDYGSYDDALVADLNTGEVSFPYYEGPYGYGLDTLSGIENVIGGNNNDILIGNGGDNILAGDLGTNTLTGNGGADTFVFDFPFEGFDTITDFTNWQGDKIQISGSGFGITADQYDRFTFSSDSGVLYFDSTALASLQGSGFSPSSDITIV